MTDIYIYVVIWYEICYGMRYVINWIVYDMIYCDAICAEEKKNDQQGMKNI